MRSVTPCLVAIVAGLAALSLAPVPASANMMATCAPEIGSLCSDVREGRGRITACLVSHGEKLGASCRAEVQSVASSGGSRFAPRGVKTMMAPGFSADVPSSCQADAGRVCGDVQSGDGRMFACLYARTDQVSSACSSDAKATLDAIN